MKIKLANLLILLVSLFGTLTALSFMPDTVPVHFNIQGIADRWGSKYEMLIMPVIMAVMLGIWFVCDIFYRKQAGAATEEKQRAEAQMNIKVINITFTATSVMFLVLNAICLYLSYIQLEPGQALDIDVMRIIAVVMGIFFVFIGNIMPKTKRNSAVGFRFPWTRYNDVTWAKCNRFSGFAMVISGLLTAVGGILFSGMTAMIVMMIAIFGSLIVILIYAYLVYMDERKKEK